jgi:hypothetical protein
MFICDVWNIWNFENTSIRHLWVDQQLYQCGSDVWTLSSRLLEPWNQNGSEWSWIRTVSIHVVL